MGPGGVGPGPGGVGPSPGGVGPSPGGLYSQQPGANTSGRMTPQGPHPLYNAPPPSGMPHSVTCILTKQLTNNLFPDLFVLYSQLI